MFNTERAEKRKKEKRKTKGAADRPCSLNNWPQNGI
jgi:hypothetical protein